MHRKVKVKNKLTANVTTRSICILCLLEPQGKTIGQLHESDLLSSGEKGEMGKMISRGNQCGTLLVFRRVETGRNPIRVMELLLAML